MSLDLEVAGLVREQLLAGQLAANAGWVEHQVASWQARDSYVGAAQVSPTSDSVDAVGKILPPYRGEMDLEMAEGTHGIGILRRRRMNVATAFVRLSSGEELRFEIATHHPEQVFYGFLAPVPIEGVRLEGRRGSLEVERLFFYTERGLTESQDR